MSDEPTADEARRHSLWLDLVAPYLDGELNEASSREMAHHVQECSICRHELARQRAVAERLHALARRRPAPAFESRLPGADLPTPRAPRSMHRAGLWTGWALALAQAVVLAVVLWPSSHPGGDVPMIEDALADYQHVIARGLPYRTREPADVAGGLSFPVDALANPSAHLLGGWITELRGESAAALAYRIEDQVVIQYVVSESLFFAHPGVRDAVARSGRYVAHTGGDSVVAWPGAGAGSLLVGDLPADELVRLTAPGTGT